MAVELYTEREAKTTNPRWRVTVSTDDDNEVTIGIENSNGENWSLLTLNNDGTFYRHGYIDADTGFKVDKEGRIVERK